MGVYCPLLLSFSFSEGIYILLFFSLAISYQFIADINCSYCCRHSALHCFCHCCGRHYCHCHHYWRHLFLPSLLLTLLLLPSLTPQTHHFPQQARPCTVRKFLLEQIKSIFSPDPPSCDTVIRGFCSTLIDQPRPMFVARVSFYCLAAKGGAGP